MIAETASHLFDLPSGFFFQLLTVGDVVGWASQMLEGPWSGGGPEYAHKHLPPEAPSLPVATSLSKCDQSESAKILLATFTPGDVCVLALHAFYDPPGFWLRGRQQIRIISV